MKTTWNSFPPILVLAVLFGLALQSHACSACYGKSDSEMAVGMNWGIFTLLGVVGLILGCVSAFFVAIGRRSARGESLTEPNTDE